MPKQEEIHQITKQRTDDLNVFIHFSGITYICDQHRFMPLS